MAWTLCTKEDVASMYPIQLSELKDSWSDMVEGMIREERGERYLGDIQTITGELHSGDGSPILHVNYPPIYSVESLLVNGLSLSPSEYYVRGSYIHLRYTSFPKGNLNIDINYTSGKLEIDETIRLAAATMIVAVANYKRRFGSDGSIKWAAADQRSGEDDGNTKIGLVSHLKAIMKETMKRPRAMVR